MAISNNLKVFSNKYSLTKTLRFELKPIGKTLENMKKDLEYDEKLQTFLKDQSIEDAFQELKPIFDVLHKQFITQSLESRGAKEIDFSGYLENYRLKKDCGTIEKKLRTEFAQLYVNTSDEWKSKAGNNKKNKPLFTERSYKILTEKAILAYIRMNLDQFSNIRSKNKIEKALNAFEEGFFTYFSGFNKNRENYYEASKEAKTAVATRIISENLPKYCDNLIEFKIRKDEYLKAYQGLKEMGQRLSDKEEGLLAPIKENVFKISNFNFCLSQSEIENYNDQIGNANYLINLYNQANRKQQGFKRLQLFKMLYKQIGCEKRESLFFSITHKWKKEADYERNKYPNKTFFSVEEVLCLANSASLKYFKGSSNNERIITIPALLHYIETKESYDGIYWSRSAVNTISSKYLTSWNTILDKLKNINEVASFNKKREEQIRINEAVELTKLFDTLDCETTDWREKGVFFKESLTKPLIDNEVENKKREQRREIIAKSPSPSRALIAMIFADIRENAQLFLDGTEKVLKLKNYINENGREAIKEWIDHALTVNQMIKYFLVKENKVRGSEIDPQVANALKSIILEAKIEIEDRDVSVEWFKWYDALRNFLIKKPQDDIKKNKLKMNFENSTLAKGWDANKEPDNYCTILHDEKGSQYLAIIAKKINQKGYNRIFENKVENQLYEIGELDECWKKTEYKLLPGPNKMLPKCLIPKSDRSKYGATKDLLDIYDSGNFKKNEENFSDQSLHKVIDFYKNALKEYKEWSCFKFSFKNTSEYDDISQFYLDVEKQGYRLNSVNINKHIIDQYVDEGKIYLFKIRNQDYNEGKKKNHKDNLHTIYWKALFNKNENKPKLNGGAEIFYRKAISIDMLESVKKASGEILLGKKGNTVIKNYRFSKDRFVFHVPITLNFCQRDQKINDYVNNHYKDDKIYFLGIDRGEKHLIYYSLVDNTGKIVEQGSFNKIGNHDYRQKLDSIEKERMSARKNWKTIGTIKELKEGYISQIIRKIADIAVENKTFIVLEDLNTGFKRSRQKIEKSIYQKFELNLAKKLNFLVDKTKKDGEIGSVTKALQLTPPVNNYGDIENRKQVGIMLYTRANYTSITDPVTGWRKSIYLKTGSEQSIKDQIIGNLSKKIKAAFTDIYHDGKDYVFVYTNQNTGKEWRLYSGINSKGLDRYQGKRKNQNNWEIEQIDVVKILNKVFENFNKTKGKSLLKQAENISLSKFDDHNAWESLRYAIEIIQQIRNTGNHEKDGDFLQSPIRDENGKHFDSRLEKTSRPTCGDANGAYNIARKGLIMVEHIKRNLSLYVSDAEWDSWLMGDDCWKKWIEENKSSLVLSNKNSTR